MAVEGAVAVTQVGRLAGGLVQVTAQLPDGRVRRLVLPATLVTVENVQIAAVALTVLAEIESQQ